MGPPPAAPRPPLRSPSGVPRLAVGVDEGAALIDVHPKTLRQMIARGECEAARIGRRVVVPVRALEALLARNKIGAL